MYDLDIKMILVICNPMIVLEKGDEGVNWAIIMDELH